MIKEKKNFSYFASLVLLLELPLLLLMVVTVIVVLIVLVVVVVMVVILLTLVFGKFLLHALTLFLPFPLPTLPCISSSYFPCGTFPRKQPTSYASYELSPSPPWMPFHYNHLPSHSFPLCCHNRPRFIFIISFVSIFISAAPIRSS
jgi:hypothetical protein